MIDHDKLVGALLDKLDELGIAEDTIVIYSTDNGPHMNSWPDAGDDAVPQREEHELGGRVPRARADPLARADPAGRRLQRDREPHGLAADASSPPPASRTSRRSCSRGTRPAAKTFKVHLDGYNLLPYLTGEADEEPAAARSSTSPTTAT